MRVCVDQLYIGEAWHCIFELTSIWRNSISRVIGLQYSSPWIVSLHSFWSDFLAIMSYSSSLVNTIEEGIGCGSTVI